MVTRADIVATARGYLGVRWHHQGRNRAGLDCVGLVLVTGWALGLTALDYGDYDRTSDGKLLRSELERHMCRVAEPQPADVLVMLFERDQGCQRHQWHLAIVTDIGIIHAAARKRKVVEHGLDAAWAARIVGAYAWPGVVA